MAPACRDARRTPSPRSRDQSLRSSRARRQKSYATCQRYHQLAGLVVLITLRASPFPFSFAILGGCSPTRSVLGEAAKSGGGQVGQKAPGRWAWLLRANRNAAPRRWASSVPDTAGRVERGRASAHMLWPLTQFERTIACRPLAMISGDAFGVGCQMVQRAWLRMKAISASMSVRVSVMSGIRG